MKNIIVLTGSNLPPHFHAGASLGFYPELPGRRRGWGIVETRTP